ncbi:MAG: VIT family protein [Acidimicrobiales bacterium]|nr:VIT family protein [Acidimicrobiales bacterium]
MVHTLVFVRHDGAMAGPSRSRQPEVHSSGRSNWLRAAVLGANDGLLSTSSLLVGVASASASRTALLTAGLASVVAGAGSMATGEYSSVSSQRDAERSDLVAEAEELDEDWEAELDELTQIYIHRGLGPELAREVATELTHHDALGAHARDELGIDPHKLANPLQAAAVSAASFVLGAAVPIIVVMMASQTWRVPALIISALVGLGGLGAIGAKLGGAPQGRAAIRVLVGGCAAMALAWAVGQIMGVTVT